MTAEQLVALLRDPRVTGELENLLQRPAIRRNLAELLDSPELAGKIEALLRSPELIAPLEGYLGMAVAGLIALVTLGALTLLAAVYNGVLLRRALRDLER